MLPDGVAPPRLTALRRRRTLANAAFGIPTKAMPVFRREVVPVRSECDYLSDPVALPFYRFPCCDFGLSS